MAVFTYQALNSSGQEVKDEVEAPSKEEAVAKVRSLGYFPTKVVEKAGRKRLAAKRGAGGIKKRKAAGTGKLFDQVPLGQSLQALMSN